MKVKIDFYDGGYCYHPEFVAIKGGKISAVKFPAICALITHPSLGPILYDTGYSEHFFEATNKYPYKIYSKVTAVHVCQKDKIVEKLKNVGIEAGDIKQIILSHFHADHIGGLKDFSGSSYIYTKSSFDDVKDKKGIKALMKGYLPDLIPDDFIDNSRVVTAKHQIDSHILCKYFDNVYDVLGDGSLIGVEIPGHAKGQLGIYLETDNRQYFLIADACFLSETYKSLKLPNKIVDIINDNRAEYIDSISRIHKLYLDYPEICIVPSHCGIKFKELVKDILWDTTDLNAC